MGVLAVRFKIPRDTTLYQALMVIIKHKFDDPVDVQIDIVKGKNFAKIKNFPNC